MKADILQLLYTPIAIGGNGVLVVFGICLANYKLPTLTSKSKHETLPPTLVNCGHVLHDYYANNVIYQQHFALVLKQKQIIFKNTQAESKGRVLN